MATMATKKAGGERFTKKYGVEDGHVYKDPGTFATVRIPGPNHFLFDASAPTTFDPILVETIDRDGKMTTAIEVWTDPDDKILYVLDGRSRFLAVQEVNRRRKKEGRELVKPYLVPFAGDEKAAIGRIFEKNFHTREVRRLTPMALAVVKLRNAGYGWDACVRALHVESADPEQYCRKLIPIAYCIPEVREAIESGELPKSVASRFGGGAPDGSKALGPKEQTQLLKQMRDEKKQASENKSDLKPVPAKARERLKAALGNGATTNLKNLDKIVAQAVAATIARLDGDAKALESWPNVAALVEEALAPLKRGPKSSKEADDEADAA